MLRRHLKRRTWAHGNRDRIITILPVGECDGRSEGSCPSFFNASAVTWLLVWFGRSVLLCHDGSCMYFQAIGTRFCLVCCILLHTFTAVFKTDWLKCQLNVEGEKVAVQKPSLLGKAYAAVCNIYCFVKTWKSKPVSPFLFFWTVVGAFDPMGVNK